MILAINALEVAVRKKDVADALAAADGGFFALVPANGADMEARIRPAIALFTSMAVNPAGTGTKRAMCELRKAEHAAKLGKCCAGESCALRAVGGSR